MQNSQLCMLRNQLWSSVFQLLTSLLSREQGFEAVRDSLYHCGHGPYLETVLIAVQDELHSSLCYSALSCLVSLLSYEMKGVSKSSYSIQNVLDCKPEIEEISEKSPEKINGDESHKKKVPPLKDLHKHRRRKFLFCEDLDTGQKTKSSHATQSISSQRNYENNPEHVFVTHRNATDHIKDLSQGYRVLSKETAESNVSDIINISSSSMESERLNSITKTSVVTGEELCKELVRLYGIYSLQQGSTEWNISGKGKILVKGALMSLLAVSKLAKKSALNNGLLKTIIMQLRELHIKLAIESVDNIIRVSDKKRVSTNI